MGIRFRCHQCGHELHVKDFQGGKRGKCPACETRFRIPESDAECSIPLADDKSAPGAKIGTALGTVAGARILLETAQETSLKGPGSLAGGSPPAVAASPVAKSTEAAPKVTEGPSPLAPSLKSPSSAREVSEATSTLQQAGKPQAIVEAPGATWYVRPPSGGQFGPAPADIFEEWLNENRVTRDSLVWREGWPQWLIAADVFVDYFAAPFAVSPANSNPAIGSSVSKPGGLLVGGATTAAVVSVSAPESLGDRNRLARKLKRRRRYVMVISVLATLAVILVAALVFVLLRNTP